jgi:hypothetical protein
MEEEEEKHYPPQTTLKKYFHLKNSLFQSTMKLFAKFSLHA